MSFNSKPFTFPLTFVTMYFEEKYQLWFGKFYEKAIKIFQGTNSVFVGRSG